MEGLALGLRAQDAEGGSPGAEEILLSESL